MSSFSKNLLALWFLLFFGIACSTGHCRRNESQVLKKIDAKPPTGYEQQDLGNIVVAKPDGSLQCGIREGMKLNQMAKAELEGVEILASEKRSDGLMRIQVCGSETGILNTYTIRHQDLPKAQKSGFIVFKFRE